MGSTCPIPSLSCINDKQYFKYPFSDLSTSLFITRSHFYNMRFDGQRRDFFILIYLWLKKILPFLDRAGLSKTSGGGRRIPVSSAQLSFFFFFFSNEAKRKQGRMPRWPRLATALAGWLDEISKSKSKSKLKL